MNGMQPQEFIDAVLRDRLASLFSLLERRAPGQRPYILVCGLAHHIRQKEIKAHQADVRAGAQVSMMMHCRLIATGERRCPAGAPTPALLVSGLGCRQAQLAPCSMALAPPASLITHLATHPPLPMYAAGAAVGAGAD